MTPLVLTIFAAASLTGAFTELGHLLEQRQPGLEIRFNFAGSQQLAAQLDQGAAADLFASADERWMGHAAERGRLAGAPIVFARNRLVLLLPATNPGRIARLQDLARPGLKLVLAAEAVPAGRYSRQVLVRLEHAPGFRAGFAVRALANVVSNEENVKGVVAKVQLGEADGGFAYRSDVTAAVAARVKVVEIPAAQNVVAEYPVAVLTAAPNEPAARAFVRLLLSAEGQAVLRRHGLLPAEARP